jgi:hypothetical protein
MTDWRCLYSETMVEMDAKQLDRLIEKTSKALEVRLDELLQTSGNEPERKEIVAAANALLSLKAARRLWCRGRSS